MSLNEMLPKAILVNEEVRRKIQAVIENDDQLLTLFFKQKLMIFELVSRSFFV